MPDQAPRPKLPGKTSPEAVQARHGAALEGAHRVVGWTIAEPVPLSDSKFEYWRSLDSWELGEAIFLLQGYEVDQTHESVLKAAMPYQSCSG